MEIKLDRSTLPKDGEHIKFKDDNEEWHEGHFCEGDDIFHISDSVWFFAWHVHEWEPINNMEKKLTPIQLIIDHVEDMLKHEARSHDERTLLRRIMSNAETLINYEQQFARDVWEASINATGYDNKTPNFDTYFNQYKQE